MKKRADIAVYDADYNLQLVVEVKGDLETDSEWATQMRRNLLFRYEVTPNAPYFLLTLPDHFYLWTNSKSVGEETPPNYIVNARDVLGLYFNLSRPLNKMDRYGFEMMMNSWIRSLVDSELKSSAARKELAWLFDSGLYETIKHGEVRIEI